MAFALKKRFIAALSFLLVFPVIGTTAPVKAAGESKTPFETEVIVRTVNQFKNKTDVANFIALSKQYGVDVISMNVKQDEDDEVPSGSVFYHSTIAPIAQGYQNFDALQEVVTAAHAAGIKVHAWIPQFHDQQAFLKHPEWQMQALVNGVRTPFTGSGGNEYFVNPIRQEVQQYERSIIQEVIDNYDVDGVVLDWIRFDNYNMDVSDYTIAKYKAQYGYSPLTIDFNTDSAKRQQWNEWRTEQIGQYVGDIREDISQSANPDVQLGVYILPPEFTEVGQNVAKFKDYIDFVAPMAYFDDWEFNSDWVYSTSYGILKDTSDRISGSQAKIVATLDNDWTDDQYQEIYQGIRENYPGVKRLSFFAYGVWPESELAKIHERETWPTPDWTAPEDQDYPAQLPAGWKARNIGSMPGNVTYNATNKQFTLSSTSTDIWGNGDQMNYIYQSLWGNAEIIVKVQSISRLDGWAKAGVMIRETLTSDSKHVDMMLTPENGATFQYRAATTGVTVDHTVAATAPKWLKLTRNGNTFTGAISSNGTSWQTVGTVQVPMTRKVYIGLALSNPGDDSRNKAVFGNVKVTQ
ncbi:family 10 glycosylhydrolase [Paenibacillus sp. NFR01]|uniref:family 10 glycosylhydrolase n=1 Tax=Paenibacillus sp. NFR01 TaxID=1566279 RepID=UPI0008C60D7E|nr:family 10 glycosylhydrolase [Paenibacillus sp. NFR01]SEU09955.1 Glycosyl hydrolase-like 10 [Paenibacillus sp. NFR01]